MFIPKLDFSSIRTRSQTSASRAQERDDPVTPTNSPKNARAHKVSSLADEADFDFKGLSIDDDDEVPNQLYISPFTPLTGELSHAFKSISDEQIINMALLLYLQALLIHFYGIGADWTPERRALIVRKNDGQKVYEARVDGFLRYQRDEKTPIMAIVEVKPSTRDPEIGVNPTRMQESAQMAAWICQHPPTLSELTSRGIFRYVISVCKVFLPLGKSKRGENR